MLSEVVTCYTEKAPNAWQRRGTQKTRNTYNQPNRPNQQTAQTMHQASPVVTCNCVRNPGGGTRNRTRDLPKKGSAFITSSDHWVPQLAPIQECVTRRKQHQPGITPNDNTTHVPTAGTSAALTKPNDNPTRHPRAKGKIIP